MNPRRPVLRPWLLACLIVAAPLLHAQDARTASMHMQGVDLRAFIQDVSRATGTTFILDSKIQGTVDISRDQAMSNEELLGVLMVVLRGNGLVAVPAGPATYRVVTDDAAAQQPGAAAGGFATEVFTLQRIDARAAAESLKPLVGRGGMVVALPQGNKLLLADYADNVRRIRGLVRQIDEDNAAIDTVSLRNTSAQELAGTLREVFGATAGPGAAFNVLPVESSNSLVIRGNPAMVRKVADMAVELDGRAERSGDVAVVRLNHSDAEQLLPVLQQLTGQAVTAPAGGGQGGDAPVAAVATAGVDPANAQVIAPAAGKRPTIVRYPGSNSLILHADPDTRRTLLDVIRQLDVPREQVLVEAIVVEISDGAAKRLGVQLLLGGKDGNIPFAATQWGNSSPGIIPLAGAALARDQDSDLADTLRKAAAESLLGLSGSLFGIGGQSSDLLFGAIIDAVSSDTGSSLLSTPSVLSRGAHPGRPGSAGDHRRGAQLQLRQRLPHHPAPGRGHPAHRAPAGQQWRQHHSGDQAGSVGHQRGGVGQPGAGAEQARSGDQRGGAGRGHRGARRPARPQRQPAAAEGARPGRRAGPGCAVPQPLALQHQDQPDGVPAPDPVAQPAGCAA